MAAGSTPPEWDAKAGVQEGNSNARGRIRGKWHGILDTSGFEVNLERISVLTCTHQRMDSGGPREMFKALEVGIVAQW